MPAPRRDQAVPFQRATLIEVTPPALVKSPPAMRSPLGITAIAHTPELFGAGAPETPPPSDDQAAPSQRAMPFTVIPSAVVKFPPATRAPSDRRASALTSGL